MKGTYVEFTVDADTFASQLDGDRRAESAGHTGGRPTVVFASKIPGPPGTRTFKRYFVDSSRESLVHSRTGDGLSMKIQVKDCANGGVFQMEPIRADATATTFTHVLGDGVFYFDNPNVRDRLGEKHSVLGCPTRRNAGCVQRRESDGQ